MDNYSDIEISLKLVLDLYASEARDKNLSSDKEWTRLLKEKLGRLGEEKYNCKICASGFKDDFDSEWLYDLMWYKEVNDVKGPRLSDVPLVVESEWDKRFDSIRYDFEKLLLANARHRLFVCYVYEENQGNMFEYFRDAVDLYELNKVGDRYLIAILDYETDTFKYDLIVKT